MNSVRNRSPACGKGSHSVSVVVNDPDIVSASISPDEAYTPLPVDGKGMLTLPVSAQRMQPVAWRNGEFLQRLGTIDQCQLEQRPLLYVWRQFAAAAAGPDKFGFFVGEGLDHASIVADREPRSRNHHANFFEPVVLVWPALATPAWSGYALYRTCSKLAALFHRLAGFADQERN